MKIVREKPEQKVINFNDVNASYFIGAEWQGNARSFVLRTEDGYVVRHPVHLNTVTNWVMFPPEQCLEILIAKLMDNRQVTDVQAFTNWKDLFRWIMEKE